MKTCDSFWENSETVEWIILVNKYDYFHLYDKNIFVGYIW